MDEQNDFFSRYLRIVSGTEVPTFFHRWAIISALGAWLGRDTYFQKGAFKVYPNMFVMLLGSAGTKKSTAIKRAKKFLQAAGYENFSAEKTTKEKFLLDLQGGDEEDAEGFLDIPLGIDGYAQTFIAADEFNDFFGNNILEFVSLLGVFWDYEGVYKSKIKNGVSVEIADPTISILGGNTQVTFANTFPPEIVGQGFFSRLIAVYAENTGRRIAWPEEPAEEDKAFVVEYLHAIKTHCNGPMGITQEAVDLLEKIYLEWKPIDDDRFASYGNRRQTHLLKLVVIHTAARLSTEITKEDVTYANTVLAHTEHYMPQAFGEFGRSRNAGAMHKTLAAIEASHVAITFDELWAKVSSDVNDLNTLHTIVLALATAKKIQVTPAGFLPNKRPLDIRYDEMVDYKYLTDAEINGE